MGGQKWPIVLVALLAISALAAVAVFALTGNGEDTYTAGQFEISEVEVLEDDAGHFEVRGRITNEGDDAVEGAELAVTIRNEDSDVGTANTTRFDLGAGDARTETFISLDDFGPSDDLEFAVEDEEEVARVYTAGQFVFTEVEVIEDAVADFEVGAQITNKGEDVSDATLVATISNEGSVVGTARTSGVEIEAGETLDEQRFISFDDYGPFDELSFEEEAADEEETTIDEPDGAADEEAIEGIFTAGPLVLSDVRIIEDGVGDFELRATVTNTGRDISGITIAASILDDGGSVVGTARARDFSLDAGDSASDVFFISLDDFVPWDDVEFEIEE